MLFVLCLGMACAGTVERPMAEHRVARTAPSTPIVSVPKGSEQELRAQIVRNAEAMIGTPYRYGGSTPAGFDCSGDGGVVSLYTDITAVKDRQAALEAAVGEKSALVTELDAVLENIDYGICFMDSDLRVRLVNKGLLNYSKSLSTPK